MHRCSVSLKAAEQLLDETIDAYVLSRVRQQAAPETTEAYVLSARSSEARSRTTYSFEFLGYRTWHLNPGEGLSTLTL